MRIVPKKILYPLSIAGAAVGLLLFGFQNCGKAGFDQALNQVSDASVSPAQTNAPFAFDSTFDQIAYNSCFGSGLNADPGYFSFSGASFAAGGVMVSQAFLTYANANLKPQYPATTVSTDQLKQFAADTPENAGATLEFSIRPRGNPQQVISLGSNAPVYGTDFVSVAANLTDDATMQTTFTSPNAYVNYFPLLAQQNQRVFQGTISYNSDEGTAYSVRNGNYGLQNSSRLDLTYSTSTDVSSYAARFPASTTDSTKVYGRGYNLNFVAGMSPLTIAITGNSAAAPNYHNPNNMLASIQEVDLMNPAASTGATWVCDPNRRYTIVRYEDASTVCPPDSFDSLSDPNYRAELEIVRRNLRPEYWDVSVTRRCAVPKQGTSPCYNAADDNGRPPEYNLTNECYQGIDGMENQALNTRCAQFVSICIRQ